MQTSSSETPSATRRTLRSAEELEAYETRWKAVFAMAALVLVICLLAWMLRPLATDLPLAAIYSLGGLAAGVALYAARRLGDAERVEAVVDGLWLNSVAAPGSTPDLDD